MSGTNTTMSRGKTIIEIAAELDQPRHVVQYVLRSRRIAPMERIGVVGLYGPDELARIKAALGAITDWRNSLSETAATVG